MSIRSILIIITGSVAAYKALELIRQLRAQAIEIDVILTKGGQQFITPLQVSSLTGRETYTNLFSLKDEVEMGHIALSRKNDAILVAPATADILAKMAAGICDDLATACLLATDKPVYIAPAMNHHMWSHVSTQRNISQLQADGITLISPEEGEMACGETGLGRLAGLEAISAAVTTAVPSPASYVGALAGYKALITAGPTHEAIDPVRYIGNHSSGKQGIAIAQALASKGAQVTLVLGPSSQPAPESIHTLRVTSAQEMLAAVQASLPADIAICTAAVADWRVEMADGQKIKKAKDGCPPSLKLVENPDILHWIATKTPKRPPLVIGFAAETENLLPNAQSKLTRKGCDWLLANNVANGGIFGADKTEIHVIPSGECWQGRKVDIAKKLVTKIIKHLKSGS